MNKVDYKKDFKELYLPDGSPSVLEVPPMRFIQVSGEGDPNGEGFAQATEALYSLSYAVKMSCKREAPQGYYEYAVFPLEGVWDLVDTCKPATDKSNLAYTIMIRQPDFLTDELFEHFRVQALRKKPNPCLDKVRFATVAEGLCCQMLHGGSYDDEPRSFARMERFCADEGYERLSRVHREIYLSDPRRTEPAKRRTVLRFQVKKL